MEYKICATCNTKVKPSIEECLICGSREFVNPVAVGGLIKYRGKLIEDMTREELIEALVTAVGMYNNEIVEAKLQRDFIFEVFLNK